MSERKWFAVKTFYKSKTRSGAFLLEERVVLFKAKNFNEAIKLGEKEAKVYAAPSKDKSISDLSYTGFCDAFELYKAPGEGREVFSTTSFYDGKENAKKVCNQRMGPELTASRKKRMLRLFFSAKN